MMKKKPDKRDSVLALIVCTLTTSIGNGAGHKNQIEAFCFWNPSIDSQDPLAAGKVSKNRVEIQSAEHEF